MGKQDEKTVHSVLVMHLIELRKAIIKSLVFLLIVFIAICIWPSPMMIYDFFATPMQQSLPVGTKMIATGVITPFITPMKLTLLVAFVISLPVILFQIWRFIAPGLYKHEKKLIIPLLTSSFLLFLSGVAFCYFLVFGKIFSFIQKFAPTAITVAPDIQNYIDFVISMSFAFGLTFEVPVVVFILAWTGVVSIEKLKKIRPYVIVGAFIIAAIVTPPDVLSQLFLAIPICLLYETGIFIAQIVTGNTTCRFKDETIPEQEM